MKQDTSERASIKAQVTPTSDLGFCVFRSEWRTDSLIMGPW